MHRKLRCVVVDDDSRFLSVLRRFLRRIAPHFEIVAFFSSLEALEYFARNRADVVITGLRMSFVDGFRLTTAVRSVDSTVPIVLIAGEEVGAEALARGASAFLHKRRMTTDLADTLVRVQLRTRSA